jgi:predicted amidohydrolase YtcJ
LVIGIVVGCATAPCALAQQSDPNSPDLVLLSGKILTMDCRSTVAEAVAIRDGKILAVGTTAAIKPLVGPQTRVMDLAGKSVVPGLIDTPAHFRAAGLGGYVVNLSPARTDARALEIIKAFVATKKPGEWIITGGWHPPSQLAEKRYLIRQESTVSLRTIPSIYAPSATIRWPIALRCRRLGLTR